MIRITPNINDGFALIRVIPNDFASGYQTFGQSANTASFAASHVFVLPFPRGFSDMFGNVWKSQSFGQASTMIRGTGANALGELNQFDDAAGAAEAQKMTNSNNWSGTNDQSLMEEQFGMMSLLGEYDKYAWSKTPGLGNSSAINPYTQAVYKSPSIRELQYTWSLVAKNEETSNDIKSLIDTLRDRSYPNAVMGSGALTDADFFQVEVYGASNGDPHKVAASWASALTSIQVNYDTNGFPYVFKNGRPVTVTLTITLQEAKTLSRQNIIDLYKDN